MLTRRQLLEAARAVRARGRLRLPIASPWQRRRPVWSRACPRASRSAAVLDALPGKKPLIKLSYRPPNYETPLEYFGTAITPNDAFFVRYHLADIPEVDAKTWKLSVGGEGATAQLDLSPRRAQGDAGDRGDRGLPVLRQPPRAVPAACRRRRMGLRRDGLRAMEGRAPQGHSGQGRPEEGGDRDRARRRRQGGGRKDAGFREEPARSPRRSRTRPSSPTR